MIALFSFCLLDCLNLVEDVIVFKIANFALGIISVCPVLYLINDSALRAFPLVSFKFDLFFGRWSTLLVIIMFVVFIIVGPYAASFVFLSPIWTPTTIDGPIFLNCT